MILNRLEVDNRECDCVGCYYDSYGLRDGDEDVFLYNIDVI